MTKRSRRKSRPPGRTCAPCPLSKRRKYAFHLDGPSYQIYIYTYTHTHPLVLYLSPLRLVNIGPLTLIMANGRGEIGGGLSPRRGAIKVALARAQLRRYRQIEGLEGRKEYDAGRARRKHFYVSIYSAACYNIPAELRAPIVCVLTRRAKVLFCYGEDEGDWLEGWWFANVARTAEWSAVYIKIMGAIKDARLRVEGRGRLWSRLNRWRKLFPRGYGRWFWVTEMSRLASIINKGGFRYRFFINVVSLRVANFVRYSVMSYGLISGIFVNYFYLDYIVDITCWKSSILG